MSILFRRAGVLAGPAAGEADDPLGLDVEAASSFPEEQLQEMFPEATGDIGSERFSAAYFLLEHHHATTFDDLKAGLEHLRRKVSGHSQNQLSFIKANTNSIMDQLDTLRSVKRRYEVGFTIVESSQFSIHTFTLSFFTLGRRSGKRA